MGRLGGREEGRRGGIEVERKRGREEGMKRKGGEEESLRKGGEERRVGEPRGGEEWGEEWRSGEKDDMRGVEGGEVKRGLGE